MVDRIDVRVVILKMGIRARVKKALTLVVLSKEDKSKDES